MWSKVVGEIVCKVFMTDYGLEEHLQKLEQLFQRLVKYGLSINLKKSEFLKTEIRLLSYDIDTIGIKPSKERVSTINNAPTPDKVAGVKRLIDMVNHYRFIKDLATIQKPLNKYLAIKKKDRNQKINLTDIERESR